MAGTRSRYQQQHLEVQHGPDDPLSATGHLIGPHMSWHAAGNGLLRTAQQAFAQTG